MAAMWRSGAETRSYFSVTVAVTMRVSLTVREWKGLAVVGGLKARPIKRSLPLCPAVTTATVTARLDFLVVVVVVVAGS